MKHIQVIYTLLLAAGPLQAGFFDCICAVDSQVADTTTVTRIKIEPAKPTKTVCHSAPIDIPKKAAASSDHLVMPKPMRPSSSTTSPATSTKSGIDRSSATTRRSHLATPATTPLSPKTASSPSTPITPITPSSEGSPSSPESPISPIITYPEHIQKERDAARYQRTTAFAQVFIEQLPIIKAFYKDPEKFNIDTKRNRTTFATNLATACTLKWFTVFPCCYVYDNFFSPNQNSFDLNEEQYKKLRNIGSAATGRPLTRHEIYEIFETVGTPVDLRFHEDAYALDYSNGDKEPFLITRERLSSLDNLIPLDFDSKHPHLTQDEAEKIMQEISVKLGPEKSLKQFMLAQAKEKADAAKAQEALLREREETCASLAVPAVSQQKLLSRTQEDVITDLTQASETMKIDPTFKPFQIPRNIDPNLIALSHIRRHSC